MTCDKHNQCGNEFVGVHDDGILMRDINGEIFDIKWEDVDDEFGLTDHGVTMVSFKEFIYSHKE